MPRQCLPRRPCPFLPFLPFFPLPPLCFLPFSPCPPSFSTRKSAEANELSLPIPSTWDMPRPAPFGTLKLPVATPSSPAVFSPSFVASPERSHQKVTVA